MPKAPQALHVLYAQRPLPASTRDVHLTFALFSEPLNPTSQAGTCTMAKEAGWGGTALPGSPHWFLTPRVNHTNQTWNETDHSPGLEVHVLAETR